MKAKEAFHGSDLEKIEAVYGIKKEDILGFASNVNPLGISPLLRDVLPSRIEAICSYPDREYTSLREAIAAYTGVAPEHILAGNGATELISLFVQTKRPHKTLILSPTYSEYERELALEESIFVTYPLKEEQDFQLDAGDFLCKETGAKPIDLIAVCNPNNPTSAAISREDMAMILRACEHQGTFVMIDETYVEFAENYEDLTAVPLIKEFSNLIILRGTSKFFAVPGLRLGYAITGNQELLAQMKLRQNPWAVHSLAAAAGELMFTDTAYIQNTREHINRERQRIRKALAASPRFKVYEPAANFVLLKILEEDLSSKDLFERCIRQRLLIRDCSDFPFLDDNYIRFCFLRPEDNDRLLEVLLH